MLDNPLGLSALWRWWRGLDFSSRLENGGFLRLGSRRLRSLCYRSMLQSSRLSGELRVTAGFAALLSGELQVACGLKPWHCRADT